MATSSGGAFGTLFREALAQTLNGHCTSLGIDQDGWLRDADAYFRRVNAALVGTLNDEAVAQRKRVEQLAFIRTSRHTAIEAYRDLGRIARAAQRSSRVEQIQIEPGQYVAKRVIDCSRRELLVLADQYEAKAAGMLRRARFYRTLEHQLALAGLDESETLQRWIDRQTGTGG